MYFLKCFSCSQDKLCHSSSSQKWKNCSHSREYHSIALANLIPFIERSPFSLHVLQSHDFICDIWWQIHLTTCYPPYNYIDIWLSLNNTTTHAFFPNISVSSITLFHQIQKNSTSCILLLWKRSNNSYCFLVEIRAKYNNILSRVKCDAFILPKNIPFSAH